jgi:hypothetical protein
MALSNLKLALLEFDLNGEILEPEYMGKDLCEEILQANGIDAAGNNAFDLLALFEPNLNQRIAQFEPDSGYLAQNERCRVPLSQYGTASKQYDVFFGKIFNQTYILSFEEVGRVASEYNAAGAFASAYLSHMTRFLQQSNSDSLRDISAYLKAQQNQLAKTLSSPDTGLLSQMLQYCNSTQQQHYDELRQALQNQINELHFNLGMRQ